MKILSHLSRVVMPLTLCAALVVPAALAVAAGGANSAAPAAPPVGRSGPLTGQERARQDVLARLVLDADGAKPADAVLRQDGFIRVSSGPTLERLSSNSDDVTVSTPYVYFDTTYYRYTAVAKYHWDNDKFGCCGNQGGDDAFGIRASSGVGNLAGVTGQFSGKSGLYYGTSVIKNPSDNNKYGVAYRKQDTSRGLSGNRTDYNMYSGVVTMGVNAPSCGKTVNFYSKVWHTWSSSSITGFDISVDGFGAEWSNTDHGWSAASQAGGWKPC